MVHGRLGSANSETLYAAEGGDWYGRELWGLGGDDILYGWPLSNPNLSTDDEIYGDRRPAPGEIQYDPIANPPGQPGNDVIYGGGGNDLLYGDEGDDLIFGDLAFGGFSVSEGRDILDGGLGNDWLYGGGGNDTLKGGFDDDYLDGAFGGTTSEVDTLTGGLGRDTFGLGYTGSYTEIKYLGPGYAIITDFQASQGDKIRIGGSRSDYTLNKQQNLEGSEALDTAIYRYGDLIAVIQDTTDVLSLRDFLTPVESTPIVIEAEDMDLSTYRVEANTHASGGELISLRDASGNTGQASFSFVGDSGYYDILIHYVDESDGKASLDVQVNGNSVDSWVLEENLGSGNPIPQTFTQRFISSVLLEPSSVLSIIGTGNSNEWARVDLIEFIPRVGSGGF